MAEGSFMQQQPPNALALTFLSDAPALAKTASPAWVRALRLTGFEQFAQTGFPTPAWEGWQHTNLRPLTAQNFRYSTAPVIFDAGKLPAPLLSDSGRVVLVNGQYQPQLSRLPEGVTVMNLMEAAEKNVAGLEEHLVTVGDLSASPFRALNAAYLRDGIVLTVGRGKVVTQPLEILYYTIGAKAGAVAPAAYPRALYWLGENSELTLIERHAGEGVYFANSHASVALENAARLRFYKFEEESLDAFHFSFIALQQKKDSSFEAFSFASGGKVAREEYRNQLIDSGISSMISGVYLLKGQQNHDFTILMDHFEPNGNSVQHLRGVIDDQARSVFQGKILVRRSAQKTDGNQSSHALLLSDQAEASFKPELEIYADDVKCGHGATSGRLDAEALFYLQSRGIPQAQARSLLIQSFLNETLARVTYEPVADICAEKIRSWLAK